MKFFKFLGKALTAFLLTLLLLLVLVWTGLMIAKVIVYDEYMEEHEDVCKIPDLNGGYVPQGIDHVADETYVFSGYHGDDMLSLYFVENGISKKIIPTDDSGNELIGHGGGVTTAKDFVYVSSEEKLIVFQLSELKAAKDGDKVACLGKFPVDTAASFCFANETHLYVGEYYYEGKYDIDMSHSLQTPAGDLNRAIVSCYSLSADGSIADPYPLYSISITSMAQGFAVKDDTFMISRSWGLNSSKLEFYHGLKDCGKTIDVSGKSVPLYYLDSSNLEKTLLMPAFSEDLDIVGDRVIVSFESACNKYIVGKLFFADKVVSLPVMSFKAP